MKYNKILFTILAGAISLTSCMHTKVSDDHDAFMGIDSDPEQIAMQYAGAFTYDNGANHSNKIRIYNNSGYACRLNYMVGTEMLDAGTDNYIDVVVPFAGDLTFTATMLYQGLFVPVDFQVRVDDIDTPIDPLMECLTAGSAEGRTWEWWADGEGGGYIDGSWGCIGGGGYGWSATGPNWICYGIGQTDDWTGQLVSMDEWVKFDLDGGPNVTIRYSDGSEKKGTFSLQSSTTPEKTALGWVGQLKLDIPLPHQITGDQYSWYLDIPVAYFDVAMLDEEHLILIAPGGGGAHIICDDSWGISSTHWTFQAKK